MTFTEEHNYVSVIGDAYGTAERWQFGFRLRTGASTNQALADLIGPRILVWWNQSSPYVDGTNQSGSLNSHRLTEVKVASIGTDGKYVPDSVSASYFPTPTAGANTPSGAGLLPQATLAVTLTTAKPRGLASKGRIYPPPLEWMVPGTDGRLAAANATGLANSFRTLINDINSLSLVTSVAVMSRGRGEPTYNAAKNRIEYTYPNAGATENVTGVAVGRVVDTQRRRRRQLVENPQAVAL